LIPTSSSTPPFRLALQKQTGPAICLYADAHGIEHSAAANASRVQQRDNSLGGNRGRRRPNNARRLAVLPVQGTQDDDLSAALDAVKNHRLAFWDAMLWGAAQRAGVRHLLTEPRTSRMALNWRELDLSIRSKPRIIGGAMSKRSCRRDNGGPNRAIGWPILRSWKGNILRSERDPSKVDWKRGQPRKFFKSDASHFPDWEARQGR
jgi:hypothetical protein